MSDETDTTSEVGDAIRELAHVVRTEEDIEGIALQVDDLWNRVQAGNPRPRPARLKARISELEAALASVGEVLAYLDSVIEEDGRENPEPSGPEIYALTGVRDMLRGRMGERPQIATQEPAGQPGAGSAGRGASGGLGERLRGYALAFRIDGHANRAEYLEGLANEADELEAAYRVADAEIARLSEFHDHYQAQVERVRVLADDLTGILSTRDLQVALDGPTAETNENEGA